MIRRTLLKAAAAGAGAALVAVIGGRARGDQAGPTVKVVPEVDLKVLDPVWTTALITGTHALLVYDTLFAANRQQQVHPQIVDKFARDEVGVTWHFELRDGLGWHDRTAVTARDCVASIRCWAVRSTSGKVMMERAERLDPVDEKSFVLKFKQPFGLGLGTAGCCWCHHNRMRPNRRRRSSRQKSPGFWCYIAYEDITNVKNPSK